MVTEHSLLAGRLVSYHLHQALQNLCRSVVSKLHVRFLGRICFTESKNSILLFLTFASLLGRREFLKFLPSVNFLYLGLTGSE